MLAGDVVFLKFFSNFLIEICARTLTKIIEILEVKRGSLNHLRRRLNKLRVRARRLPLDGLNRLCFRQIIPAQRFVDLRNVIVYLTLIFKLRVSPILRLIFLLQLDDSF